MQNSKFEDTYFETNHCIKIKDKLLDLSTPIVMGILNATPDSFFSTSREQSILGALKRVESMVSDGVQIVDIGGYSSRPGATDISIKEEINRVAPIFKALKNEFPELTLSIDTFRSEVAHAALDQGAGIVNDISGFSIDPKIVDITAQYNVPYILMHMKGTPQTMQSHTEYQNIFKEMALYFSKKIELLHAKGVHDVIIDPGFGFAKNLEQNHFLLRNLHHFQLLNKPILAGLSRKSMIYKKLNSTPEESLSGTVALNTIALTKGASILRVHDVKEATDLIRLLK